MFQFLTLGKIISLRDLLNHNINQRLLAIFPFYAFAGCRSFPRSQCGENQPVGMGKPLIFVYSNRVQMRFSADKPVGLNLNFSDCVI